LTLFWKNKSPVQKKIPEFIPYGSLSFKIPEKNIPDYFLEFGQKTPDFYFISFFLDFF
jgi:hypothetical protein